MMKLFWVTS